MSLIITLRIELSGGTEEAYRKFCAEKLTNPRNVHECNLAHSSDPAENMAIGEKYDLVEYAFQILPLPDSGEMDPKNEIQVTVVKGEN